MFAFRLAKDLGLPIKDVLDFSTTEFLGWVAFYKIEEEERKKYAQKANRR